MEVAPVVGASDPALASTRRRSHALPRTAVLPLTAIVVVSAAVWGALGLLSPTPWIFPDELLYVEIAKSLGDGGLPAVRDVTTADYGLLYPLLLAPAFALTPDADAAYTVARLLNALVMSLAAVPAYYLARRFVERRSAYAVAVFTVLVPSMAFVGTLLTEVVLYPTFLLSLLAITAAVERPTRRNQVLALGSIGLVFLAKPFGVVLLGVYCGAILLYVLLDARAGGRRARLAEFKLTWIALAVAAVGGLGLGTVVAGDPVAALGIYAQSATNVDALGTVRWMAGNLSALALYLTAIPVAATVVVLTKALMRRSGPAEALYASITIPAVICVMAVVAAFGSTGESVAEGFVGSATELRERNFFLVAPLLLIGLAMWIKARDRSRGLFLGAAAMTLVLLATYPWSNAPVAAGPQNLAPVPWFVVSDSNVWRAVGVIVFGLLALALLRLTPWSRTGRLWVALAAVFSLTGLFAALVFANAGDRTVAWGLGREAGWIDRAVPAGSEVGVVWFEPGSGFGTAFERHRVVWVNEYFNDALGTVYGIGGRMPYSLPEERAVVRDDGVVTVAGVPLVQEYVLTCGAPLQGTLLERDARTGAELYRTGGVVRFDGTPAVCPGGRDDDES